MEGSDPEVPGQAFWGELGDNCGNSEEPSLHETRVREQGQLALVGRVPSKGLTGSALTKNS